MYAIIETSGKQYKVAESNVLDVGPLPQEVGETVSLSRVMMLSREGEVLVGKPVLEGADVKAVVVGHLLSRKIKGFKYKSKDNYQRRYGSRQPVTRIRVKEIKWPAEGVKADGS
jgi:large subunit ribosomal protein L21